MKDRRRCKTNEKQMEQNCTYYHICGISCVGEFSKYKACFLEQHDYADISWSSDVEVWNPPAWDTTEGNITGDI